ncbi:MAG: glycosyltransferase [Terriglobales bacterium]|jgi:1,2-diacylglycerol 3-beta-galactosyltransferase
MKKLTFIFFDAGGGHRSAATALRATIEREHRPWDVELLNLQELLDFMDPFLRITGIRLQDIYNRILANGWTLGSAQLLQGLHAVMRMYHARVVRELNKHWSKTQTDAVVSLVPNLNRAIAQSVKESLPGVPFVTILTDLADYPPHFWMERESQFLICGSDRAVEQARALGHSNDRIFHASGMILNPVFYEPSTLDRDEERKKLGLQPGVPTALALFGGFAPPMMEKIVSRLEDARLPVQMILICGRNEKLADLLRRRSGKMRIFVEGFTRNVPYYMRLADFFIGKTGPGSISEAVAMILPVIVERNAWTLPQERYNADWILQKQVGIVLPNFRDIASAVGKLLESANLGRFRDNCAAIKNDAVFEIPEFLEQILVRAEGPAVPVT